MDVCVAMMESLGAEQMCQLVRCLRSEDVVGATRLLDLVTRHEEGDGRDFFNHLTLRRELAVSFAST